MERDSWVRQIIMVWEAIEISHKAVPVIFENIGPGRGNGVTALRNISHVLRLHIVSYFGCHQHHMFQQDNVRAHNARSTRYLLKQHNLKFMPWLALSSDLNPTPIIAINLSVSFLGIWAAIQLAFFSTALFTPCTGDA